MKIMLFIPPGRAVGLPSVSIPYHRFEIVGGLEISNTDSPLHNLGVAMSNHRLADHLGSVRRSLLICIFLGASYKLLLIVSCMSDSPHQL
jgi:hypothetical protein